MNILVKKEIRMLRPGWLAVLGLMAVVPWLAAGSVWPGMGAPAALFLGMVILSVDVFGREFSLGTFLSLMSQPLERQAIWQAKIKVLTAAAGLVFVVYSISCSLRFHWVEVGDHMDWRMISGMAWSDWLFWFAGSLVAMLVALSGALWTSLLLRQLAAAFWITFLIPLLLLMGIALVVPAKCPDSVVAGVIFALGAIYSVAGFWLAHRLFQRAQDVAWTGGVVDFSRWRYFERGSAKTAASVSGRSHGQRHRPVVVLLKKEFQLHSISLFCAGTLLVLHLLVILLRALHGQFVRESFLGTISEFFWIFWLVMPLVIGCMSLAEERKLGMMEGQFCLPVSRRLQFAVKFFPVLCFGALLGGVMPMILEMGASAAGLPSDFIRTMAAQNPASYSSEDLAGEFFQMLLPHGGWAVFQGIIWFWLGNGMLAVVMTLAGIFASSLSRNFLQALGLAILGCAICFMLYPLAGTLHRLARVDLNPFITVILLELAVPCLLAWLAFANYKYFAERARLWYRNIVGIVGTLVLVLAVSAVVYNRAWELLLPAEPAHGAARFSSANPPKLLANWDTLQVRLPDGRVWLEGMDENVGLYGQAFAGQPRGLALLGAFWRTVFSPLPRPATAQKIFPGPNWLTTAIEYVNFYLPGSDNPRMAQRHIQGYTAAVGIQTDGSLWISEMAANGFWPGNEMKRVGAENDWSGLSSSGNGTFLLKTDGTLWCMDASRIIPWLFNPQHSAAPPESRLLPVGTRSDWRELQPNGNLVRAVDGTVWRIARDNKGYYVSPALDMGGINFPTYSEDQMGGDLNIHPDGTLWVRYSGAGKAYNSSRGAVSLSTVMLDPEAKFQQWGRDTNWLAAVKSYGWVVGLKADGTLWQWGNGQANHSTTIDNPDRLGIHADWLALGELDGQVVALAADGSLWLWPNPNGYGGPVKLTRQPQWLADVPAE